MIPHFPKFKKLEFEDKKDIENITREYPPYSDFNFTSMWSWNIKDEMCISMLHENLIVRFNDYITGEPFYSFLGNNKTNETAQAILDLSEASGIVPILKLVPEHSIQNIDVEKYVVEEDRDHFDYILSTEIIKDFASTHSLMRRKKRAVNSLIKEHSPSAEIIDLSDKKHLSDVFQLIEELMPDEKVIDKELQAISRFVENSVNENFLILGAFVKSKLVGFSFTEILENKHAVFHFWKADIKTYKPLYSFLLKELCTVLHDKHKVRFLNIEQDLGIENLRKWKESFTSNTFLKKYRLYPK